MVLFQCKWKKITKTEPANTLLPRKWLLNDDSRKCILADIIHAAISIIEDKFTTAEMTWTSLWTQVTGNRALQQATQLPIIGLKWLTCLTSIVTSYLVGLLVTLNSTYEWQLRSTHLKHGAFNRPLPQLFIICTNLQNTIAASCTFTARWHLLEIISHHSWKFSLQFVN